MKLIPLMIDTLREIYAKKVIIGIVVIEVIALVITGMVLFLSDMREEYAEQAQFGQPGGAVIDTVVRDDDESRGYDADTALLNEFGVTDSSLADAPADTPATRESSSTFDEAGNTPTITDPKIMLYEAVRSQLAVYAGATIFAAIFLGMFVTAGIIPSMMEKGTIDLLLSKPVPRTYLLFGRALGGVLAMAVNLLIFLLAVWTMYGLVSGVWYFPFVLWTFTIALFTFLVFFSAIVLLNVMTESWILPLSLIYVHMMILSTFLSERESTLYTFIESPAIRSILDGLYWLLPQSTDLMGSLPVAIFTGSLPELSPFIHGTIFIIVMLSLAAWRFEKKDF